MTIATEWAKRSHRTEYFVTIEGIGWPSTWADLSNGFDGVVWTTNDIDGDLAAKLGCTVKRGLTLPTSIDFSIDARDCTYRVGGLDFVIEDREDWWAENYTPRRETGHIDALDGALEYQRNKLKLVDGSNYEAGSMIWIAGRECCKYEEIDEGGITVTRGYLGTPQGSNLRRPGDHALYYWPDGTSVDDIMHMYWGRKAALWAHVPGEASTNCLCLWLGALRRIRTPVVGRKWSFTCVSDIIPAAANRVRRSHVWSLHGESLSKYDGSTGVTENLYNENTTVYQAGLGHRRILHFGGPADGGEEIGQEDYGKYALATAYQYRTEPRSLDYVTTQWDTGYVPTALDTDTDTDIVGSFVDIEGDIIFMFKKDPGSTDGRQVQAEIVSHVGTTKLSPKAHQFRGGDWVAVSGEQSMAIASGTKAKFLLANWHDNRTYNRFTVNGRWTRNPIDIALCFMMSCDREFFSGGAQAGSTATTVNLTLTNVPDDAFIGRALFALEADEKWESRVITDNDSTSVTVETAFSGAPSATEGFQVRNSIYDVLPLGWGMGIDVDYVDVAAFERLRDTYFGDAVVDPFIMGSEDEISLWDFVYQNIFKPNGVLVYFNRETRKLTPRYIPQTPAIDDIEDYTTLTNANLIKPGNVADSLRNPVGMVELEVRAIEQRLFMPVGGYGGTPSSGTEALTQKKDIQAAVGGNTDIIVIKQREIECAFHENELDKLTVSAGLDTRSTAGNIIARLVGVVKQYAVPPHVYDPTITLNKWLTMYPGTLVEFDWDNVPINPFTGVRGWANVIGRVLSAPLPIGRELGFTCTMELLQINTRGKIAPAATTTGKANDGTYDYWTVNDTDFVQDDTDVDWHYFVAGMEVELRDATGAVLETETIVSFGSNHKTDPTEAADSRVNVVGAIATAWAAGQYITLRTWYAGNPAANEDFSAYASAAGLLTGGDTARRYV